MVGAAALAGGALLGPAGTVLGQAGTPDGAAARTLKPILYEVVVPMRLDEAWRAWTAPERMREWFAPEVEVDLRPTGPYRILFFPDDEPGLRGAEWSELLAVVPERMLRFTWYAPPHLRSPAVQRTTVAVRFEAIDGTRTRVLLEHDGWVEAEGWGAVHAYFGDAWRTVLGRFAHRASVGPWPWHESDYASPREVPRPVRLDAGEPSAPAS